MWPSSVEKMKLSLLVELNIFFWIEIFFCETGCPSLSVKSTWYLPFAVDFM